MAGFEIAREDSVQEVLTDTKQVNTLLGNIDDPAGEASVVALLRLLSQGILATGVKSVQRGTQNVTTSFSGSTANIYISSVDPEKCVCILNSNGIYTYDATIGTGVALKNITENNIQLKFGYIKSNSDIVSWQLIEFY